MESFLSESICLARNGDSDQWMQILVFVVIAVIYGLGAILKARASKIQQRKEQAGGGETASRARVRRRTVERPFPRRPAVATVPLQRVEMQKAPPVPAAGKPVELELIQPTNAGYGQGKPAAARTQPAYISELLSGYPQIAELRKAILYYEIFGKPLSLRAPGQYIIGL